MKDILYNNYSVQESFDSVPSTIRRGYLSKTKALEICRSKRGKWKTSYRAVEHISILGIVPFNDGFAYVFNQKPPVCYDDSKRITTTGEVFEELMNCYVYTSISIDKTLLESLISEYKERGGKIYESYQSYNTEVLNPIRQERRHEYRTQIVETIFKHNFREEKNRKWENESAIIQEIDHGRLSLKYGSFKSHTDLETSLQNRMLIGSIFGEYKHYTNLSGCINQLSENEFCIRCNKPNKRYNFCCFLIKFKN